MQVLRDTRKGNEIGEFERGKAVFDMRELETEREQRDGKASLGPVHVETGMDVPAADADLREAQAGCAGCGNCACGMGREKVKA